MTEPHLFYYCNIAIEENPEAAQWLDDIPIEKWALAWDNRQRWRQPIWLKETRNILF